MLEYRVAVGNKMFSLREYLAATVIFFFFQVPEVKLSFPIRQNIYIN